MSHFCLPHLPVVKASGTVDELAYALLRSALTRAYNKGNKAKRK